MIPRDAEWYERARRDSDELNAELEALENGHWNLMQRQYREFWQHAKAIAERFRASQVLRTDRERLWARYRRICDGARETQDRERVALMSDSEDKRRMVDATIEDARVSASGARTREEFARASALLRLALQQMKDEWEPSPSDPLSALLSALTYRPKRLLREHREASWRKWVEANEALRQRRDWIGGVNKDIAQGLASEAHDEASHGNPHEALKTVKAAQQRVRDLTMSKDQWEEVRGWLNDAWTLALKRIGEQRTERVQRDAEWRDQQETHVARWSGLRSKNEGVIEHLRDLTSQDEERASSARTSEFEDTVRGWIEEKRQKIIDIQRTNEELGEKIRSVTERLRAQ